MLTLFQIEIICQDSLFVIRGFGLSEKVDFTQTKHSKNSGSIVSVRFFLFHAGRVYQLLYE